MAGERDFGEPDVLIVGAGITGCVAAKYLATDHDVLVVDRGPVAGETTAKASGLVTVIHDYESHPEAARYAIEFFDDYDGTGAFDYTRRATVALAPPEIEADRRAAAERLRSHDLDVEFLDVDALHERFPDTLRLDAFAGGVVFGGEGWVDPYTLAVTYQEDAESDGARFETGVTVESITTADGAVTGVETDAGTIEAGTVVVAAAWHTRALVEEFVSLPIRPFRYQTVNLETEREFEDWYPIVWEPITGLYWRPEHNGELHVGGGTYFSEVPPDVRTTVTDEFRQQVARSIGDYVAGIDDAQIASDGICPEGDAATPDGLAIYDAPDEAPDGLVVATGLEGFGIMASPVSGAAVRSIVTDEDAPFDLAPFALDRFDDRSTDFGSDYILESPSEFV